MHRRLCFYIVIVLLVLTSAAPLSGSLTLSPEVEKLFFDAIELLYYDDLEGAIGKFDSLCIIRPDEPMGYFCKAFAYDYIMDAYRTLHFMEEFREAVELSIEKAEDFEKNGIKTSDIYLFSGGAVGMRGIREAMLGNWFGAFKDALKAAGRLDKSIELDPTMYDAYFGLGSYHYWKSVKSKVFWWLPFVDDNREKGIEEIKLSIEKGKFTSVPGEVSLLRIYLEEKNFDEVIGLAEKLKKNTNCIHSQWFAGYALIYREKWKEAIDVFNEVLARLSKRDFHGIEGDVECYYYIAMSYYNLGDKSKAKTLLEEKVLANKKEVDTRLYFYENPIKGAEKLLKVIEEKQ